MAFYDYEEDRPLIKGAFCASFGMLPQDFEELLYPDYLDLFPSIHYETTFASVVNMRAETDRKKVKDYTPQQRAEWEKWHKKFLKFQERQNKIKNKEEEIKARQDYEQGRAIAKQKLEALLNKNKEG